MVDRLGEVPLPAVAVRALPVFDASLAAARAAADAFPEVGSFVLGAAGAAFLAAGFLAAGLLAFAGLALAAVDWVFATACFAAGLRTAF
ncbi:serine acetyltransferase [Alcanivorax sp.]|uniref:serine acetyltransferase n=1 Tax=Alcanivorax sp. TaxID=1872427 RepID=UPI0007C2D5CD|nr:serine acetyltransferase [Alcanivorax sp.]KZX81911.1 hypothetical protein A3717_36665 [Alcanivorax sp. HI0013]MBB10043.1 hypothetical protein [Alcanivorax sp.]MBU83255.1 hypothetical protein [Alcanivorax sp.]